MPTIRETIERFNSDRRDLTACYPSPYSRAASERFRMFYTEWRAMAEDLCPETDPGAAADAFLFRRMLGRRIRLNEQWRVSLAPLYAILPFLPDALHLADELGRMRFIGGEAAGAAMAEIARCARDCAASLAEKPDGFALWGTRLGAVLDDLEKRLGTWCAFYGGYDPEFDWWTKAPRAELDIALANIRKAVETLVAKDANKVEAGVPPVGREALVRGLLEESVGYSPEDLTKIAERHYEVCESQMRAAALELGFEHWPDALEHCKGLRVTPGEQPKLVLELLEEAIAFVEERDLLTVPSIAKETIQMEMMSAAAQRVNPFFLGGEKIVVSYPTCEMSHDEKLMSMRGNNPAFSRATVQHELIPGHHMQWFAASRFKPYREPFSTPFWIEGWTLHWEMLLWDLGFPRTPEERIGMLFWRMHRCVRVIFSLGYHLGELTPDACVEMLVKRVGHERANAEAEVRRSFGGEYDPLYQLAYLIGGLMVRDMYREWKSAGNTPKEFHDRFLAENDIDLGVLRARLFGAGIHEGADLSWSF